MKNPGLILLISGYWLLVSGYCTNTHAQQETLTLLTYYPAPYGVYQQLRVQAGTPVESIDILADQPDNYITMNSLTSHIMLTSAGRIEFRIHNDPDAIIFYNQKNTDFDPADADNELANDTELMRLTGAGLLGIGTNNPASILELGQNSTSTALTISSYHNTETTSPSLTFRKADNTMASPQPVDNTARLGTINFQGYDDNSFETGASIYAIADADWGVDQRGAILRFQTRNDAASLTDQMTIAADGDVSFKNMPGIAFDNSIYKSWSAFPTTAWNVNPKVWRDVDTLTVQIPALGYLLIQASGDMYTYYPDPDDPGYPDANVYWMEVGISTSSNTAPSGAVPRARMDANHYAGPNQHFPFSCFRVYTITAADVTNGSKIFYVTATLETENGFDARLDVDGAVYAIYFPVEYNP